MNLINLHPNAGTDFHIGCHARRLPALEESDLSARVYRSFAILRKEMLCSHDVEEINHLYWQVDCLEKKLNKKVAKGSSQEILQLVINKVKKLVKRPPLTSSQIISPQSLISLYHLQNFCEKELPISAHFQRQLQEFKKQNQDFQVLAKHLPYCMGKENFEQDAKALLGSLIEDPEVDSILAAKKAKIQQRQELQNRIQAAKEQLVKGTSQEPDKLSGILKRAAR